MPLDELMARYIASFYYWCAACPDLPILDYASLPAAIWMELAAHFRLSLAPSDIAAMRSAAKVYSKDEARRRMFVPDSEAKRAKAKPALFELIDRIVRPEWTILLDRQRRLVGIRG
jgi:hypothetical protein